MAYIENVVIGKPIAEPQQMFALDENDWNRIEQEKDLLYKREVSSQNSCGIRHLSVNQ